MLTVSMSVQTIFDFGGGNDAEGVTTTHNRIISGANYFLALVLTLLILKMIPKTRIILIA